MGEIEKSRPVPAWNSKLTRFEVWSLVLQFATAICALVALGSILFAAKQLGQATQAQQSTAYVNLMTPQLELYKVFVEHPAVRKNFYSDAQLDPNSEDYHQAIAVADYYLDFFDVFWNQSQYLPNLQQDTDDFDQWRKFIQDTYKASPVLRRRLHQVKDWYDPNLVTLISAEAEPTN